MRVRFLLPAPGLEDKMATGLSIEERRQIAYEVMLVAMDSKRVYSATCTKVDLFEVLQTILTDSSPYSCTPRQTIISVLKKSPVWSKVRPFLTYGNYACDRKGCQCGDWRHENKTGKCSGYHYVGGYSSSNRVPCQCPGFVQKDFK